MTGRDNTEHTPRDYPTPALPTNLLTDNGAPYRADAEAAVSMQFDHDMADVRVVGPGGSFRPVVLLAIHAETGTILETWLTATMPTAEAIEGWLDRVADRA